MSRRNQEPEEDDAPSAPAWMTTYGDMMTLLMTFFILIMSFATIEVDKFKAAMGSLKGAFGVLGDSDEVYTDHSWFSPIHVQVQRESVMEEVERLRELISEEQLEEIVEIYDSETEVLIRIRDRVLFELGSDELKPEFLPVLGRIVTSIEKYASEIRVVGHTDNLRIHTEQFPSNWELSMHRALKVVKYLIETGQVKASKILPAGQSKHRPIVPNDSPENRAKNRRVEIHVKL